MKILFFDMEFANGQVPGSIYSIGYLMTDSRFRTVIKQTDLLINPECRWNWYVRKNILAYPIQKVETAPSFPQVYKKIQKLLKRADVAIGFAVSNDVTALKKACDRYGLPQLSFSYFDVEKLCKSMPEHPEAHGLSGYVKAWCSEIPTEWHRSDVDAYATMLLFKAVCEAKHVPAQFMLEAYEDCGGQVSAPRKKKALRDILFGGKQSKKSVPKAPVQVKSAREATDWKAKPQTGNRTVSVPTQGKENRVYVQRRAPKAALKKKTQESKSKST